MCLLWDLVELSLLTLVNSIYVLLLLLFVCLFVLLDPESYHIVLAGLELTKIPLPLLSEWWDKLCAITFRFLFGFANCPAYQTKTRPSEGQSTLLTMVLGPAQNLEQGHQWESVLSCGFPVTGYCTSSPASSSDGASEMGED